eukprot:scaffold24367_cov73-Attheya_sp.AAC.3
MNRNMTNTNNQEDQIKPSYLDFMPYIFFAQTDGRPDHNITLMRCRLAAVAVFLLGNMDRMVMVRGCPQLSFLNVAERAMSLLNIGLTGLSLKLKPKPNEWFKNILSKSNSMAKTRE